MNSLKVCIRTGVDKVNTVLKYPGSKWRIADWIIQKIPEHHTYIEPYFGSGGVFFKKPPSAIETINDLDCDVVNLFDCIRENPEKLAYIVSMTPYARNEYDRSFDTDSDEPYEKARLFLVKCWQGHGFRTNGYKVGWKNDVQGREAMYAVRNWYRLPEWILNITERLKNVQIESRPAIELIKRHNYDKVFVYADPPYLLGTRTGKQYKHEMSDEEHEELLEVLLQHKGKVIISGYDSNLYNHYLKDWHKEQLNTLAEHGKPRIETIWMNYDPPGVVLHELD